MVGEEFVGFGVRGYRSFGSEEIQRVGPMSKIHLVVGQNNVGKSNLLHFFHDVLQLTRDGAQRAMIQFFTGGALDTPDDWDGAIPRSVSLGIRLTQTARSRFGLDEVGRGRGPGSPSMFTIIDTPAFSPNMNDGVVWFDFDFEPTTSANQSVGLKPSRQQFDAALKQTTDQDVPMMLNQTSSGLPQGSGGEPFENFARIVGHWAPWRFIPSATWVDAVREITRYDQIPAGQSPSGTRNGRGLIEELAKLQSPDHDNYDVDNAKFVAFLEFTRAVLDDPKATIIIPDSKQTVLLNTKNGRKPIANLGTGIGELIMLAAATTVVSDVLVCIEEPEIHLHPSLQRRLIQYLADSTNNRYLISTHSAALLNAELASISHVTMDDKWSRVDLVAAPKSLASTVADLGNRASDLVQSNFVVWVEGPSDRIYVCHWLSRLAPELVEGAHYSVMFYGGALLNHLTADDDEVNSFIKLTRINRNLAVLIDSDKSSAKDDLNPTKDRVLAELANSSLLGWVTDGYTVENYIPRADLEALLWELYPGKRYVLPRDQWKSPLGKNFVGMGSKPSKISVAKAIAAKGQEITWPTELESHVLNLAERIRRANDLPNLSPPVSGIS